MTKQEQIADFIAKHITLPRMATRYGLAHYQSPSAYSYGYIPPNRPSVEQVAEELLGVGEFRALQLGTWLGTTDGQVIAEAVEMVTPPLYRQDVELLVAALRYAAQLQQQEGQKIAGRVALGAVGVAALVAVSIGGSRPSAPAA